MVNVFGHSLGSSIFHTDPEHIIFRLIPLITFIVDQPAEMYKTCLSGPIAYERDIVWRMILMSSSLDPLVPKAEITSSWFRTPLMSASSLTVSRYFDSLDISNWMARGRRTLCRSSSFKRERATVMHCNWRDSIGQNVAWRDVKVLIKTWFSGRSEPLSRCISKPIQSMLNLKEICKLER